MTTDNGAAVHTAEASASADSNNDGDLDKKIIRQVEYYFGDYNLGRDKFLKESTNKDEGWFPLETLVKFNRLKSLSTDYEVITNALRKSEAGLLEIHEDGTKVRRSKSKPLPTYDDRRQEDVDSRSVYVKGFPRDLSIDDLLAYFKQHGNVEHIQMRYMFVDKNKKIDKEEKKNRFKGSVFIVYPTKDEAEEFQKKENVKHNDQDLHREMRKDYFARKREARIEHRQQMKKQKIENNKAAMEDSDDNKAENPTFEKGCVLRLTNIDETMRHEEIKEFFLKHAEVAFVDYKTGDLQADVRFKQPKAQEAMDKAKEANDGKLVIKEVELTGRVLEGDEEVEFWKKSLKDREHYRQKKFNQRGGGRGGRGGRGGGRGGRFNRNRDGRNKRPANKSEDEPGMKKDKVCESKEEQVKEKAVADVKSTSATPAMQTDAVPEVAEKA